MLSVCNVLYPWPASTTDSVPSPLELKASCPTLLYPAASGPSPIAGEAICLPLSESTTAIFLPSQTENRRWWALSKAIPEGESQSLSGQVAVRDLLVALSSTMLFLSSMLSKMLPFPSACGNSGFPGRLIVATTVPLAVSMTVTSLLRPLKAQTVRVTGS